MIRQCMRAVLPHYKAYLAKRCGQPRFRALGKTATLPFAPARCTGTSTGSCGRPSAIDIVLSDGSPATIRGIGRADRPALLKFLGGLSARTCLSRGWSPLNAYAVEDMAKKYLRRAYSSTDGVLVMTAAEEIVGLAEHCRMSPEKQCELAIVIADDWQGRKAGTPLLEAAIAAARTVGYRRAFLDIALDNARMLAIAKRLDFAFACSREGHVQMEKAL